MDYLKQLITYFKTNHLWVKLKYGNNKDFDPKEISEPIVKAIKDKETPLVNPDDISNPIVSAQKETTQAIKEIVVPEVKIPKVDFSELSQKITDLKEVLLKKEMVVNQGDVKVNLDLKPAIKAIEKLEQSMPKFERQEVIDYTLMFDEMMKIMETPRYSQYLETMTGLLKIISERKEKELPEYFKLDKHQLAQLIPISMIHAKHLNLAGAQVNPATEEKQDNIISAIDGGYPAGAGSNGTVTLTNATTAYSVPATASTKKHILIVYNGSDTDMYVGYATLTTGGILLPSGGVMNFDLGANQGIFAYCSSTGKIISYTYKEITA